MPPPITTTSNRWPETLALSRLAMLWLTVSQRERLRLAQGAERSSTHSSLEPGGGVSSSTDCQAASRPEGGADTCTDTPRESRGGSDASIGIRLTPGSMRWVVILANSWEESTGKEGCGPECRRGRDSEANPLEEPCIVTASCDQLRGVLSTEDGWDP